MQQTVWIRASRLLGFAALTLLALVVGGRPANANFVWGTPTTSSSDLDVNTEGTLVGAFNIGSVNVPDTTINGVLFQGLALTGSSVTSGNFTFTAASGSFLSTNTIGSALAPFSNLSASYQTLLSSIAGTTGTTSFSLTMNGLQVGNAYLFQWWVTDTVVADFLTTATSGTSVTLHSRNATDVVGGLGEFATGTFTAATSSVTVTFTGTGLKGLNGFQLRTVTAVPEPSSMALTVAGAFALVATGYRKRTTR